MNDSMVGKQLVVSAYDSRIQVWGRPQFMINKPDALRGWEEVCNDGQSPFSKHPTDFALYAIGIWDDQQGVFMPFETKQIIASASEVKKQHQ